ncbi:MAG: M23 family metallopeptidase [bacterium]|nr:M23 family metallopeptidase [bacterium]
MFFWQFVKLLPGEQRRVFAFHYLLSNLRKLHILKKFSISTKVTLGGVVLFYLLGYQPTLSFPPFKQSVIKADFVQEQDIASIKLPHPFILPHPGYLTTRFSSWHPGVDIATGYGMPIHPITSGQVTEVIFDLWGLGHHIVIQHDQGFASTYAHMGRVFVKVGDLVTIESTLGEVGLTGHTSGPHTHLEITNNGKYIDPLLVLPTLPGWPGIIGKAPRGQGPENIPAKPQVTPTPIKPLTLDMTQLGYPKLEQESSLKTLLLPLPSLLARP